MSETKKEKIEQTKTMISNYVYLIVGAISFPLGKLIFSSFSLDLALMLFLIVEASQVLGLKLLQIWFAKIDPNLWNKAKDEFEDAKDGVLGDTQEVKLGIETEKVIFDNNPKVIAEKSPDNELAFMKYQQTIITEAKNDVDAKKVEINGKVKELEAKEANK